MISTDKKEKIQQALEAITLEDINDAIQIAVDRRTELGKELIRKLKKGLKVEFVNRKTGREIRGNIVNLGRTRVHVRDDNTGTVWTIPPTMVTIVTAKPTGTPKKGSTAKESKKKYKICGGKPEGKNVHLNLDIEMSAPSSGRIIFKPTKRDADGRWHGVQHVGDPISFKVATLDVEGATREGQEEIEDTLQFAITNGCYVHGIPESLLRDIQIGLR